MIHLLSTTEVDTTIIGGVGALIVTLLGGFYKFLSDANRQASADREADRLERQALSGALERVAIATERSADEARERNGHLAELTIQSRNDVIDVVQTVNKQTVKEQVVNHQTVQE